MHDFFEDANSYPLDPELFMQLCRVAIEALIGRRREIPPDAELCLEDKPGGLRFTDVPINQMAFSIIRECKVRFPCETAEQAFRSFMFRWFAIEEAQENVWMTQFVRRTKDGGTEVHEAVLRAAATCPMTRELQFDGSYEGRIRAIIAQE